MNLFVILWRSCYKQHFMHKVATIIPINDFFGHVEFFVMDISCDGILWDLMMGIIASTPFSLFFTIVNYKAFSCSTALL